MVKLNQINKTHTLMSRQLAHFKSNYAYDHNSMITNGIVISN